MHVKRRDADLSLFLSFFMLSLSPLFYYFCIISRDAKTTRIMYKLLSLCIECAWKIYACFIYVL